jgi:hypothetical protein
VGHGTQRGKTKRKNVYNILVGRPEGKRILGDICINEDIIKMILKKKSV